MSKTKDRKDYFKIRKWFGLSELPVIQKEPVNKGCLCCGNLYKSCDTVAEANKCDQNKF